MQGLPHSVGITSPPVEKKGALSSEFWLLLVPGQVFVIATMGLPWGHGGREPREGKKEGKTDFHTVSKH